MCQKSHGALVLFLLQPCQHLVFLIKVPLSIFECQKSDLMLGLPCRYVLCRD